jgi:sugar lactone lactonase YvrE
MTVTVESPDLRILAEGLRFPEGPVAMPDGSIALVEIEAQRITRVAANGTKSTITTLTGAPNGLALGPNGTIWYVDYARGFLGRLDPRTGQVKEWASPSGQAALPYAMASDDLGRLWYVETGPRANRLVAFDPATERFVINQAVGINSAARVYFNTTPDSLRIEEAAMLVGMCKKKFYKLAKY